MENECANPLFARYLLNAAQCVQSPRRKARLNEAHRSVIRYPLPLRNGSDALALNGVTADVAKQLDTLVEKVGISTSTAP